MTTVAMAASSDQPRASIPTVSNAVPDIPVPPPPDFKSKSWVLMDYATGRVLAAKKPNLQVEPASITKVMTDYVVSVEIASGKVHPDDLVHVSENAWRKGGAKTDGSTSFLKLGSKVSIENLMYGLIVQSGNDAAIALAEHIAGSERGFVAMMNAQAKKLGMVNTHYVNVSGYPVDNHYSSAYDTALLSRSLIKNFPADYKISSVKKFTWNGITQYNRNTLLWSDPSVDGIKTGHTAAAGYCLAASSIRDGRRLIAVVMGTPSAKARVNAAEALLNYGYRFFETHKLYDGGKPLASLKLWKGKSNTLPVGLTKKLYVSVKSGSYDKLKVHIEIPSVLIAPYKKGDKVGTLVVSMDGKNLVKRPLVALADAQKAGFFSRLWDSVMLWFHHDSDTVQALSAEGSS